jgi:hypothetical protein
MAGRSVPGATRPRRSCPTANDHAMEPEAATAHLPKAMPLADLRFSPGVSRPIYYSASGGIRPDRIWRVTGKVSNCRARQLTPRHTDRATTGSISLSCNSSGNVRRPDRETASRCHRAQRHDEIRSCRGERVVELSTAVDESLAGRIVRMQSQTPKLSISTRASGARSEKLTHGARGSHSTPTYSPGTRADVSGRVEPHASPEEGVGVIHGRRIGVRNASGAGPGTAGRPSPACRGRSRG